VRAPFTTAAVVHSCYCSALETKLAGERRDMEARLAAAGEQLAELARVEAEERRAVDAAAAKLQASAREKVCPAGAVAARLQLL
jgi:hypothetical protein